MKRCIPACDGEEIARNWNVLLEFVGIVPRLRVSDG